MNPQTHFQHNLTLTYVQVALNSYWTLTYDTPFIRTPLSTSFNSFGIRSSGIWRRVTIQSLSSVSGQRFGLIFTLKYETTTLPRNVGNRLSTDVASYPRKKETSAIPLRKSKNWHSLASFKSGTYDPEVLAIGRPLRWAFILFRNTITFFST
jgi:hypothetical protein